MNIKKPDPVLVDNIFNEKDFIELQTYFKNIAKTLEYQQYYGRWQHGTRMPGHEILKEFSKKTLNVAREVFKSDTLMNSFSFFAHYEGNETLLRKHVDDNACTYTLDMCLYKNQDWDLWVEGKPYNIDENQALAFYGEDQVHWRNPMPSPEFQHVAMVFFHFVEPDHWWFTKGPEYLNEIRKIHKFNK